MLSGVLLLAFAFTTFANECGSSDLRIIQTSNPKYPVDVEAEEGWVKLRVIVASNGIPYQVSVIEAEPKSIFDAAAKNALMKWRFNTSTLSERCGEYTFEFKLEGHS